MNACKFQKSAMHTCGSYQFNLGKYQGDLCDVHYWQYQAEQLRQLCSEMKEALQDCVSAAEVGAFRVSVQAEAARLIEKYTKVMGS